MILAVSPTAFGPRELAHRVFMTRMDLETRLRGGHLEEARDRKARGQRSSALAWGLGAETCALCSVRRLGQDRLILQNAFRRHVRTVLRREADAVKVSPVSRHHPYLAFCVLQSVTASRSVLTGGEETGVAITLRSKTQTLWRGERRVMSRR